VTPELDLERSYGLIKKGACALETSRDAVVVRGPDARGWLQGQVSQDLGPLALGDSAETLVLSPQGKVDSYCRATILADDVVLLDTETGYGEALSERLRRFRLRVKAELESRTVRCLEVRGPASAALASSGLGFGMTVGGRGPDPGEGAPVLGEDWSVAVPVSWTGYSGFDVLAPVGAPERPYLDVPFGDPAAFEAARIEAGVPALGRELTEKTIPQEAGSLVEHTVSFTKGCYTGQELVARLDARGGNVAWRLRGVVLDPAAESPAGARLFAGEREVGRLTSVTWSPGFTAPVALAYVRRDAVPPFLATAAPHGAIAKIWELPLQIG
jgi:folate-binding protein YgfZ